MKNNLIQNFKEFLDEFNQNNCVEIIHRETNFPNHSESVRTRTFELFNKRYEYKIPENMKELVSFPAKLYLYWKVRDSEDPELIGEFCLQNIINVLTLNDRVDVTNEDIDEDTKALMRKAHYFDTQPEKSWTTSTVLIPEESKNFPDLWLLDDLRLFRMNLSIEQYFDVLFLTKGMYYWQYLFCDKAAYIDTSFYKKRYIMEMLKILPEIFPRRDYSLLIERFHEISDEP
ncbi:MAG: hypothetical protein RIB93_24700 [Coleofasciculus sp. D1-CHI-01]|uniref:hypothetical protein n=1 Tax=Coleofasciculus sp. D1-CHI-01 TaxID=3068482 RepID=UPI0032FA9FC6